MLEDVLVFAVFVVLTIGIVFVFTSNPLMVASVVKMKPSTTCDATGFKHSGIANALFLDEDHTYILPPKIRLATLKEVLQSKLDHSAPHIMSIEGLTLPGKTSPLRDENGFVVALATITNDNKFASTTKVVRVLKNDGLTVNMVNPEQPYVPEMFPANEPCTVPNDDGAYRAYVIGYKKDIEKALDNEDIADTDGYYLHAEQTYILPQLGLLGINKKVAGF